MALLLGTVLLAAAAAVPPAGPAPRELARSVLETHGQELRLLRLLGVARTSFDWGTHFSINFTARQPPCPKPAPDPRGCRGRPGRVSVGWDPKKPRDRGVPAVLSPLCPPRCSAAPPRCPCSPSCPTCRCRWWSAAGSRSPGTAPSPAPLAPTPVIHPPHPPHHHHPRDPPRGLGPLPARPCRDNPAAPCPQRSCNKEISDSDMCVCGAGALGEPGAPSALAKSDGATLGLCNLTRERVTSRDPEGFRCHVPCPGTQRDPPAPRVPTKPRLCGSGLGVCQGWSPGASPQAPVGDKRSPRVALATAMASSWMLLLALLGVACALPAPEPLAYTQALARAVESYNQRPEVQNAFRLLSAEPEPEPGVELSSLQAFNLSMMETECAASARRDPEDCDFKENGVIIECLAKPKMQQVSPEIDLSCSDASSNPVLVERGRFGRFVRKIRRFRPSIRFDARLKGTIRIG